MLSSKNKARFLSVLILLAMVFSSANFSPARAVGGIVVNSDTDTVGADGLCILREAIDNANSDSDTTGGDCTAGAGADIITFAADYTITLDGSQLPAVTSEMTIIGNGAANTIIQANVAPNTATYRVFDVTSTGNLTLDGVTVRHGKLEYNPSCGKICPDSIPFSGGGIRNFGTLSVTDSTISGNNTLSGRTPGANGGGIYNGGTLSVTDSTISGNTSTDNGGGIYNGGGTVTITNSIFSGNSGDGIANGGGTVTITNSTFSGNFGAGIRNNGGTMNVTGSTLSGNFGTGIRNNGGTLNVTNSTLSGNSASIFGGYGPGAIYNNGFNSTTTVTNSTISDNNGWVGGGISNGGVLTVTDSILSGNSSKSDGGGIYNANYGTLNVTNSTLSGNSSDSDGGYGGGAIYNGFNSTTTVTNSTISGNTAGPLSNFGGGGIYNHDYGTVTVTRSLVSGNSANAGDEIYAWAPIASTSNVFGHSGQSNADAFYGFTPGASDFNATSDGTPTTLASILDTTLADNGGPTQTHALVAGSPAIDFAGACGLATDQRGVARPQGAACDAGAFELESDAIAPTAAPSISSGTAGANGWYTSDVTVDWNWTDTGGSGIDTANCTASNTSTSEGNPITLSATCKDLAGNTGNASYDVKVDKTKPTLNPIVSPNPVLLNGVATVTSNATDALSGLASSSCGALDTSTVGGKSVTCTATDNAGNSNSATVSYNVNYNWSGFFQPVDNLPTLNSVKAGSAVPVKFSLAGNQGLNIFAAGYPASQQIACSSTATDTIETTVTAVSSSLSYDATTGQYNYVWKTDKAWAGTCRTLTVKLIDGTIHQANFQFTR